MAKKKGKSKVEKEKNVENVEVKEVKAAKPTLFDLHSASFNKGAISTTWKRNDLILEAKEVFKNVIIEEFNQNPFRIAFVIGSGRLPTEGYYSVN
jgi:hypothetical protein